MNFITNLIGEFISQMKPEDFYTLYSYRLAITSLLTLIGLVCWVIFDDLGKPRTKWTSLVVVILLIALLFVTLEIVGAKYFGMPR